jgi:hypothetical protein
MSILTEAMLAPHELGGAGMGDPVVVMAADAAVNILAGLAHPSGVVRTAFTSLLLDGTILNSARDALDDSARLRLNFVRHAAEVQLHLGDQLPRPPRRPLQWQPKVRLKPRR